MALLNWIFWKKAIFTTTILGLTITPVILVNKYGSSNVHATDSPYKQNLEFLSGNYAKNFGITPLTKEIFGIRKAVPIVENVFAEDLAYLVFEKSNLFKEKFESEIKEEETEFTEAYKKFSEETGKNISRFYDSKGGNRESMKRRTITTKAYEEFKKEITNFDENNFTLNRYSDSTSSVKENTHISKQLIEDPNNWKHIGFFSREEPKHIQDREFAKYKFEFINYAHKKWFQDVRPFYVWMSLWKHKPETKLHELESVWNSKAIKEKEGSLDKASYSFPYYSDETTTKFKSFYKDIVSKYDSSSNTTIYIPNGYTEDSASAIFVEGKNMYSNLYIRFAAAANYKYQIVLDQNSKTKEINAREKTLDVSNFKQPTELFMFESSYNEGGAKARVKVSPNLFNQEEYKAKNEIGDLVEIKNTPWVFIRNRAGIHAIAVDSANIKSQHNKDIYGHFQFRTLQLIYKHQLNLTQTLDIKVDSVIKSFKEYLEENFNSLLVKYAYSKKDNKFFGYSIPSLITDFKESYTKYEELEDLREKYLSRTKLRDSLLTTYVQHKWEVDDKKKFKNANLVDGMVGMIPWGLKINEDASNTNDFYIFDELEKIYDFDFFNNKLDVHNKSLASEFKGLFNEYLKLKDKYVDSLNLALNIESSAINTDRVFTNNYYINRITDSFLDRRGLFNEFLFKYILKSDYLGKSVIGNKGFINLSNNFEIKVPEEYKEPNGTEVITETSINDTFGTLDKQIKASYYSKLLLENESKNPWDVVKHNSYLLNPLKENEQASKLREQLQTVATQAFDNKFTFEVGSFKSKYYKFLTSLAYLTANNFENLLKYLRSQMSYERDTYIMFAHLNLNKENKDNTKLSNNSLHNPLLNREGIDNMTLDKEISDVYKYFSSVNFEDSTSNTNNNESKKVPTDYVYKGFYTGNNESSLSIPYKYSDSLVAEGLYRYGNNKQSMNKYILSISSNEEYKKVIDQIKKVVKTNNDWVSNLSLEHVYISNTGAKDPKTIKTLTLQEKKNLLSAYLNDVKVEINNSAIDKDKYKQVFLTDPDASFNSIGKVHTYDSNQAEKKLDEIHFNKFSEVSDKEKKEEKVFKLFQINLDNVKNYSEFKTYVNNNLSKDIFWTWIINLAMNSNVQEKAIKNLSALSEKIEVYDSKWAEKGEDKYIKK